MSQSKSTKPSISAKGSSNLGDLKLALIDLVQSLQFAWFVGQLITLISVLVFSLGTFGVRGSSRSFVLAILGICETFGILIFQTVRKSGILIKQLVADDTAQYFALGVSLLVFRPQVLLVLIPFGIFSLFHVLGYIKSAILPVLGFENHPVLVKIGTFVANNHAHLVQLACMAEVYAYIWLTLRLVTFRLNSVYPWIAYTAFIKMRFDKLAYTRNYFKSIEIKIDQILTQYSKDVPQLKNAWTQAKAGFSVIGKFSVDGGKKET